MSTASSSTSPTPVEGTSETSVAISTPTPPAAVAAVASVAASTPPAPATAAKAGTPPAPEGGAKEGRTPGPWNKAQLLEMALGEQYCLAAMQERFAAIFTKAEFPPARLTAFHQSILAARNQTATAGQCGTASEEATLDQATAEKLLLADIRKVQAAAKQKHARTNPTALKDYLVGTDVTESRPALQQHSQTLLKKLETERPPSIDTEFIQGMTTHRTVAVTGSVTQNKTEAEAEKERFKRDQQIEDIKDERIAIQYVIDGAFGPGDPANAAARREFGLSPNRPFNAVRRQSA